MSDTWLFFAAGLVVFAGVFVYVLFMVFLPEWVGITGDKARETQRSHRGDEEGSSPDDRAKESSARVPEP